MTTEYGQELEQMIQDSNPTGPRVSLEDFNANITDVEVFKVITKTGKIMRWAVLTTKSGFAVTGNPSVAVSEENDRPNIGEKIAVDNAKEKLWELMGYELSCRIHKANSLSVPLTQI